MGKEPVIRLCIVFAVFCMSVAGGHPVDEARPSPWEKDISAFEEWDARNAWPRDSVLFVGSSSIRMWPTAASFRDLPVINRGFGGSQTSDVVEFTNRIVLKYAPRLIVLYAGDNDIAAGKSPRHVLEDYKAFVARVHEVLPRACIIYLAIKPSMSRWGVWDKSMEANKLIREYCVDDTRLFFVDCATPLLGPEGTPDERFYVADRLHLSPEGYRMWTRLLSPIHVVKEIDWQTQSLAIALIKGGMGPHNVPAERLDEVDLGKAATEKSPPFSSTASQIASNVSFVASKTSKIFHKSTCRFAATIADKNKQSFTTREQAAATGRRACQTCKP